MQNMHKMKELIGMIHFFVLKLNIIVPIFSSYFGSFEDLFIYSNILTRSLTLNMRMVGLRRPQQKQLANIIHADDGVREKEHQRYGMMLTLSFNTTNLAIQLNMRYIKNINIHIMPLQAMA